MNRITVAIVLVGLVGIASLSVSSGLAEPTTVVRGPNSEKLTALRTERRDVLRQAVKQAEEAYRNGVAEYTSIPRTTWCMRPSTNWAELTATNSKRSARGPCSTDCWRGPRGRA